MNKATAAPEPENPLKTGSSAFLQTAASRSIDPMILKNKVIYSSTEKANADTFASANVLTDKYSGGIRTV